jgi:glycolate oxidase
MPLSASLRRELVKLLGEKGVLDHPRELTMYEYDGGVDKHRPDAVLFASTTEQAQGVVVLAREQGVPLVGRGAGTGLSGGAIPRTGGWILSFARMNEIESIEYQNERAMVQAGVVNLELTQTTSPNGYYYAPDPSSQKACTIGGNVAENAGGPHTLAYGVTTNHTLGLEAILPDGTIIQTGPEADLPGYDLTGLLTGSEGTLGLICRVIVRLMRQQESVKTMLAIYNSVDDAANTVAAITAKAIVPAAVEMLDGDMLRMVEEATHAGYPLDAAAVLLIEVEGLLEETAEQVDKIRKVCQANRAREFRVAQSEEERLLLWKGRKNAFGAIGRVSSTYYVQDGVVPRTQIAPTLRKIEEIGKKYGLKIGNIFHAGDGNMHPIILFDAKKAEELDRARKAGDEILEYCISVGGSITGEHGVGMEKMELMSQLFSDDSLEMIKRFKTLFDPICLLNPGKVLPLGKGCMEIRQPALTATNTY